MADGTTSPFGKEFSMSSFDSLAKAVMPVACVLIAATAATCSPKPQAAANPAAEDQSLDSLRAAVLQLIGEPMATSVAQCRLTAFGAKPCGGPRTYLVYSTEATDSTRLARAVAMYTSEDARMYQQLGRASDCGLVTPPQITFAAGQCATAR